MMSSNFLKILLYVSVQQKSLLLVIFIGMSTTATVSNTVKVSWSISVFLLWKAQFYLSQSGVTRFEELLSILWSFQPEGAKPSTIYWLAKCTQL